MEDDLRTRLGALEALIIQLMMRFVYSNNDVADAMDRDLQAAERQAATSGRDRNALSAASYALARQHLRTARSR